MAGAVHAAAASVGGRFLLVGCTNGLLACCVCAGEPVKRLPQGGGGVEETRGCHSVGGAVRLVAVLGETPLIAFVLDDSVAPVAAERGNMQNEGAAACGESASSSRVVRLYDLSKKQTIAELLFQTAVVGIQMNSKRLVVALAGCIDVFDILTLRHIAELRTTSPPNPNGIFALSELTTNCRGNAVSFLVYPQSERGCGDVWVTQITEQQVNHNRPKNNAPVVDVIGECREGQVEYVNTVEAHCCAVVCLAMTRDGMRLATASARGTTVKVFELLTARLLYRFRRGITTAQILSLSFDPSLGFSGARLAALSSRGTLHVFRCSIAGENELVAPTPGSVHFSATTSRCFAQANVKTCAEFYNSSNEVKGCLRRDKLHYCFFSEDGQSVWVLLPAIVNARGELGGNSFAGEKKGTENITWVLHQYTVHSDRCELVNSEVLF